MGQCKICPGIGHLHDTRFLCNVVSEVSCKYFPVPGDEITSARRKGFKRGRDSIREKEINILIWPEFIKAGLSPSNKISFYLHQ